MACLKQIYRINASASARREVARSMTTKHVYLVWSVHSMDDYSWFSDVVDACVAKAAMDETLPRLNLFIHLTRQDNWDGLEEGGDG